MGGRTGSRRQSTHHQLWTRPDSYVRNLTNATEDGLHFRKQVLLLHGFCAVVFAAGAVPHDTGFHVRGDQFQPDGIKRRSYCRDLIEDVDAVAIVGQHSLHASDLTDDTVDAFGDTVSGVRIHV